MANVIRLNGVKRIEVNDEGEYILLPVGDDQFLRNFYALVDEAQKKAAEIQTDSNDILGSMDVIVAFDKYMMERVDGLFGAETCHKVFGNILPGVEMYLEFFTLLTPYLEEYKKDRAEAISKYSAGRRGSSV